MYLDGRSQQTVLCARAEACSCSYPMQNEELFYLTMHSTHFIYGYMASYIW